MHSAFQHLGAVIVEVKVAFKTMKDNSGASGSPILERHGGSGWYGLLCAKSVPGVED